MAALQETLHSLLLWKIPVRKFYHIFSMLSLSQQLFLLVILPFMRDQEFLWIAESGVAPKIFLSTTKAGVPYVAVLFTAAFGALGYLVVSNDGTVVFNWLLNIAATAGLVAWGSFLLVISDL